MLLRIDGAQVANARARGFGRRRAVSPSRCARRFHEAAVRRHAHRQFERALGAARLRRFDGAQHRGLFAGDDHLPRRIEIHGFDDRRPARPRAQAASTSASSRPNKAAIAPVPAGTASCIDLAAKAHEVDAGREVDGAGGDERGEFTQAVAGDDGGLRRHRAPATAARWRCRRRAWPAACVRSALSSSSGPSLHKLPQVVAQHGRRLRRRWRARRAIHRRASRACRPTAIPGRERQRRDCCAV